MNFPNHRNRDFLPSVSSKVRLVEGGKCNIPDENSLSASKHIINLLEECGENDIVLVLMSG